MNATEQETVRAFIRERFMRGHVLADDTALFSSGIIDSFGVLELIAFLEDTFGVSIDPADHALDEFDNLRRIAQVVNAARADAS